MDSIFLFPRRFEIIFPAIQKGHNVWTDLRLKRLRYYLIKLIRNVKNGKIGNDIMPTTLKQDILDVQRALKHMELGFLYFRAQRVFVPKNGLFRMLIMSYMLCKQSFCALNTIMFLSSADLKTLYASLSLSKKTAKGYLTRLIFSVGLVTSMRPTAKYILDTSQFKRIMLDGKVVWKITGMIGSAAGALKTNKVGWSTIGEKPPEVCVWDESYVHGTINFFHDLDCYMSLHKRMRDVLSRFFLGY